MSRSETEKWRTLHTIYAWIKTQEIQNKTLA